jgi:two-component system phosphate regulon sensor histidine kinase PhoR
MNRVLFRLLVFLMSISLIGIILVQVYWFNSSLENNQEQFKFHVKQVLGNVSANIQEQEILSFVDKINQFKDSTGSDKVDADFWNLAIINEILKQMKL